MEEKNIKIVLSFNGAKFFGWQYQNDKRSVQGTLEAALKDLFGSNLRINGCGRTDSMVHAIAYTANFKVDTRLNPADIRNALNFYLPPDIYVKEATMASGSFHSRYDAKSKIYRYLATDTKTPLLDGLAFFVRHKLDMRKMAEAAEHFKGKKDFAAFRAAGSSVRDTVREVFNVSIGRQMCVIHPGVYLLFIEIEADGFLYKMARNIAAALIDAGLGKLTPSDIDALFRSRDRSNAPPTAPPYGLYLKEVIY